MSVVWTVAVVLARRASADCEAGDGGLWEQDVNAWSSSAYVVVGAIVLAAVARGRLRRAVAVLGLAAVVEGVGSLLYHGAPTDGAWLVHDVGLYALVGYVAGWAAGRLRGAAERWAVAGALGSTVAGALLWLGWREATNVMVAVAVLVVVVAEVVARRRDEAPVWDATLLVLVAVAVAAWLLGRSDSPVCEATSWAQPHGAWHVLTAIIVLVWVDRTSGVDSRRRAGLLRQGTDVLIGWLARLLVRAFHRSVDVTGRDRIPADRPVLIVANHGNGFVDPVVVTAVLGRLPRFIAKATLWKVVVARPFLALAGVLPVHRRVDGGPPGSNRAMFAACHRELARGATIAIFPEGTTGDRARLERVRTGAARIALGSVADAPDLVVVPIGLAFESRVQTRSRAVVMVGQPIEAGPWAANHVADLTTADDDHEAVRALTDAIRASLEAVSPEFASVDEREWLRAAAEVRCRVTDDTGNDPRFGDIETVARRLAAAPAAARTTVVEHFDHYAARLRVVGLDDRDLSVRTSRRRLGVLALAALTLIVGGSVVAAATIVHLPALIAVVGATGLVRSTATKGTVRLLVGLVTGLVTWIVVGVVLVDGLLPIILVAVLVAALGAVALATWSTLARAASRLHGWLRARDRAGLVPGALDDRATLVHATDAALDAGGAGP